MDFNCFEEIKKWLSEGLSIKICVNRLINDGFTPEMAWSYINYIVHKAFKP